MQLSLILPCYNEEQNARTIVGEVFAWFRSANVDGEVIAVDDGSRDGTFMVLCALQREWPLLQVLRHERNRGYGLAVRTGIDAATREYVAFMDSDGQFRAASFSRLLPLIAEAPFIAGYREKRADAFNRIVNARVFGFLSQRLLHIRVRDINCGMKLFRRDLWSLIRPEYGFGGVFNAEMFARLSMHGIPFRQVAVPHYPRQCGKQTGATPAVIVGALRDLWHLKRSLHTRA